jgi:hypothetical protein
LPKPRKIMRAASATAGLSLRTRRTRRVPFSRV